MPAGSPGRGRGQRLLKRERAVDLADELSDGGMLGTHENTDADIERIGAITAEDVQRVAQTYLDPDHWTQVVLHP